MRWLPLDKAEFSSHSSDSVEGASGQTSPSVTYRKILWTKKHRSNRKKHPPADRKNSFIILPGLIRIRQPTLSRGLAAKYLAV